MRLFLEHHPYILMEAAVVERLRRDAGLPLHPTLLNAPFIYDERGWQALESIYRGYMATAQQANLPLLLCTPTWRANRERVAASDVNRRVNQDAVAALRKLVSGPDAPGVPMRIGGLMACKNDCYRPDQALDADAAETFHSWQAQVLAEGGADFLIAQTLPSVEEALGLARAMAATGKDYLVGFVIRQDGRVFDGSTLTQAIERLDNTLARPPLGYVVNCAYPTFLHAGDQPPALFQRLIGFLGNASAQDQCALDGSDEVQGEPVSVWGQAMLELRDRYRMQILGGCCGTGPEHLAYIARH